MENKLTIGFLRENKEWQSATVKYALTASFSSKPLYIGQDTISMYTITDTIDWGKVIKALNDILDIYLDAPNMNYNFIGDIALDISMEDHEVTTLYSSYRGYQEIMGSMKIQAQVEQFLHKCKMNRFIPTINGTDLESILKTK